MSTRQDRERAHWASWKDSADTVWGWRTVAGMRRADRRARLFRELAHLDGAGEVLEIGCGTGEFTARVAPHVEELCAVDLSPELLERARAWVSSRCAGAKVRFEVQDAMALTLPEGRFDGAFGCSVLHHLDAGKALREICRVLKPGRWCAFSEPNMLNPQIAIQKNVVFVKRRVGDTPDETAFFRGELARLLAGAGFVEIRVEPFDFLHPLTPEGLIGAVEWLGRFLERVPLVRRIAGSLVVAARKPAVSAGSTSG